MVILAVAVGLAGPQAALGQTVREEARSERQPLGVALEQFGRRTGFDIVFPENLVKGLLAGSADDKAPPHRALAQLLQGTGLVARFTRPDAVILERAQAVEAPDMVLDRLEVHASAIDRQNQYRWYGQHLLDESLVMLRGTTALATKSYDLFVYLWVDPQGKVTESRAYGASSGEASLAASALKGMTLKLPPPADMPQPVGLRIGSH